MILAIDIGNTNIVIGLLEGQEIRRHMRCATDKNKTPDEFSFLLHDFLTIHRVARAEITGAILSSVVPVLRQAFKEAVYSLLGIEALVVGPGLKNGLNIKIDNPAELGSDLVVNAIAALHEFAPPLIIIDMGTATTFSYIDGHKVYQGGLILPGLSISVGALVANTAQLRNIDFSAPEQVIGKNTVACMKAGAIYGQAAMIDGLIERIEEESGQPATAVATGGLVAQILGFCKKEVVHKPFLMLEGLALLYERNTKAPAPLKVRPGALS